MGIFDFVANPVTGDDPCGPDLDGTDEYDVTLSDIEGKWPDSYLNYLNPDKFTPFKPGFDAEAELAPLQALLKKSHDIRLLVPCAKFAIMSGNIAAFSEAVGTIARLLGEHWEGVHPRASDGSNAMRESHLSRLTETATIMLPLQDAPFCTLRRLGKISYRTYLLATKAVAPREKEAVLDEATLRDGLVKHDEFDDIVNAAGHLNSAAAALAQIRAQFVEKDGAQNAPDFEKLTALLADYGAFLRSIMHERDPLLAAPGEAAPAAPEGEAAEAGSEAEGAAPAAPPKGLLIGSTPEAAAALKAVEAYFHTREPSNPATLLVRQAQQLVGKSFIEAMVILNPALAEKAAIKIGGDVALAITSAQMKALAQAPAAAAAASGVPEPVITNRAEALAHMEAIEKYYQRTEPSSPIPLLLGRARSYSGRDFAALMKEIGPS